MANKFQTAVSRVLTDENKCLIRGYSHQEIIARLSFVESTFLVLRGELPTAAEARMTNALLVCLCDHGFVAASTLTGRYCASGNPQLVPATAAALLTAGANTINPEHAGRFLDQALRLMQDQRLSMGDTAKRVVENVRASKQRIPGLGHPTHKGSDYRAVELKRVAEENGFAGKKLSMYEAIFDEFVRATGKTQLCINVDGMMGCIMSEMGFNPLEMMAIAALSVLPGQMAHIIEEILEGKRLRFMLDDQVDYIGEPERPLHSDR